MAAIETAALRWYADLLASGKREFTLADSPLPARTVRRYMARLRDCGWCDFQVVKRGYGGRLAVYNLPAETAGPQAEALATRAAAFCRAWNARGEGRAMPLAEAHYTSLAAYLPPETDPAAFDRALLSKLLEAAANPQVAGARESRRLAWLRAGLARLMQPLPGTKGSGERQAASPPAAQPAPDDPEWLTRQVDRYRRKMAAAARQSTRKESPHG